MSNKAVLSQLEIDHSMNLASVALGFNPKKLPAPRDWESIAEYTLRIINMNSRSKK